MKKGKRGFTLIEVAIFLAVTGALFVAVTVGVQNSVYQQRNNDSVQNFMEFLRKAYSEVTNVQNSKSAGGGRTEKAIYGKLITFGEKYDLAGNQINGGNAGNQLFMYTVVGNVLDESGSGTTLELLDDLKAQVVEITTDESTKSLNLMGLAESYTPKWSAQIEYACSDKAECYKPIEGMLLIVRHPSSGSVYTYYTDSLVQINEKIKDGKKNLESGLSVNLDDWLKFDEYFKGEEDEDVDEDVDFCINSSGAEVDFRNDVRINAGAKSSSGIELVTDEENKCIKR
jgi:type II secretory pathway pseudopilin PulG